MAAPRRVIELAFSEQELADLMRVSRSRTEPASRVERARILLAYRETPSLYATGRAIGVTHQTVERCLRRAQELGIMAALDDSPRPGRDRTITNEARTFIVDLACRKPKDLGYPHELWTTRLLARHVREQGPAAGHACLAKLAQGTLCKILAAHEIKPHKVRYYLERRDPEFAEKMAEVLCVYREVALLKQAAQGQAEEGPAVAIISYDEKPGIQALATTAPDLPPEPMRHESVARDHEYVRLGTLSLLAGIDLFDWRCPCQRRGKTPLPRVRRVPQTTRRGLSDGDRDQAHPRQSLRPHIQGNQGLARQAARGALHLRVHAQTRLMAQPRRGIFLKTGPLRASPNSRRLQTGTAPKNPRRHRGGQPRSRRSHLDLQNRSGRVI